MDGGHLIPLGSGEFAAWRELCFRCAGMPFDWVSGPTTMREPMFLEALTWQNQRVAGLLSRIDERKPDRQFWRTIARYRARYCAKNDSIGFFGPTGWGEWTDGVTKIGDFTAVPRGPVFFEIWAVQAVADALVLRHGLHEWAVLQVAPAVAVAETGVYLADGSYLSLSERQRDILAAVDGFRTAADVIAECDGGAGQVATEIRILQSMGVLTKGFHITQTRHPERQLAAQLARVADPVRRDAATAELGALLRARDDVQRALGDPAALAESLGALDQVFGRVSEQSAQRREAQFYAARSVSFEDCVNDLRPEIGVDVLHGLAPALELLLHSARWFSARIAAGFEAECSRITAAAGTDGYPLPQLLSRLTPMLSGTAPSPVDDAAAELRRRWTAILTDGTGAGPLRLSSDRLRDAVLAAFPAASPGWPSARWHSPDLMFEASSVDDLAEGRHLAVLGELHPTINAVDQLGFFAAQPDQAAMRRWIDADMPYRIVPLYQMSDRIVTSQTAPPEAYHSPGYTYLGVGTEPSYAPRRARVVAAGGLRVHHDNGRLVVRGVDGFSAPLVEVLDDYLALAAYNRFGLLEPAGHTPRVQIDNLVIARERWTLPLTAFAHMAQPRLDRVLRHVREVAEDRGLPRRTFWSIPGEPKPMYLDLDDAGMVDAVWAKVRRARERDPGVSVTVTEMLPGPEGLWLRDPRGRRYTAEIRLVCVDRQPYRRSDEQDV